MELSVNLSHFCSVRQGEGLRSLDFIAGLCSAVGYRFADFTPEYKAAEWETIAEEQCQTLEKYGITVEQTHAPFNRYGSYGSMEEFFLLFHRSFVTSAMSKAKYVVVHADEYRTTDHYDPKEIVEYTYGYLAPEVEYAKAHGMQVAIENLFEDAAHPTIDGKSRFTSRVEEIQMLLERFHDPAVCVCWDFGHGSCSYTPENSLEALKKVGEQVRCTHVHDNYYGKDLHLLPFTGKIPWEEHMTYLKGIGYAGKLSFEFVYDRMPDALLPTWMKMTYETGKYLCSLAE